MNAASNRLKKPLSYEQKKHRIGFCFLIPWMIGAVHYFLLPLLDAVLYSFGELQTGYQIKLIGLQHYINAFAEDSVFLPLLTKTIPPLLYKVPIIVILSLFLALLINQKFVGRTTVRVVFFLPIVITNGIIITIINGDALSQIIQQETSSSNLFSSEMLSILLKDMQMNYKLVASVTGLVDSLFELIWKSGLQILLFLSALQTIPVSMFEAAKMEGGTAWENFWKITFPLVSPTILINVIYTIIDCVNDYSNDIMVYINGFAQNAYFEYSSALSVVYTVLMLAVVAVFYLVINRFVYYEV